MATKHSCHYLKERNRKRIRNQVSKIEVFEHRNHRYQGSLEYSIDVIMGVRRGYEFCIQVPQYVLNGTNDGAMSLEQKMYKKILEKYIKPNEGEEEKKGDIPTRSLKYIEKFISPHPGPLSVLEKELKFLPQKLKVPPRSVVSIKISGDTVVFAPRESSLFSAILKGGERIRSQTGAFDMYWTSRVSDIKIIDGSIGAVLYENHKWSDRAGGIGMSLKAVAQYNGDVYVSKSIVFRDQWKEEKDDWSNYATEITGAKVVGDSVYLQIGGDWIEAKRKK